ncbi:hypothetical protein HDU89_006260 [Geranomyces variabilis]|nr:hypothetical protein HDU89_006260 [Geranomyces variabilis]
MSSSSLKHTSTPNAPAAIGPYSQAVVANGLVYTSGCLAFDSNMKLHTGSIADQTRLALKNLEAVLKASGSSLDKVIKTTVFLKNMDDFKEMNGAYAEVFGDARPARSTVEVSRLPADANVEIEAIGLVN